MSWYEARPGLKIYRFSLIIAVVGAVLSPVPVVGTLLVLIGGVGQFIGLLKFVSGAPSSGLGVRLATVVGLSGLSSALFFMSIERSYFRGYRFDAPVLVMAMLCAAVASVALQIFWKRAAEDANDLRTAERFRIPIILSIVSWLVLGIAAMADAPFPLVIIISLCFGLPQFLLYWSALGGLDQTLAYGGTVED